MEPGVKERATRRVTTAILFSTFAYGMVNSITSVLINDIVDAFQLTGAAQGLITSMLNVGLMLALLAAPLLQGRIRKLSMLLLAGLLQVLGLSVCGATPSFALFVTFVVVTGVGSGWLDSYVNSCMVDVHPDDGPHYLGLLHGTFGIASLLAPLAAQWLMGGGAAWRGVHFAFAGCMLLAMLIVAWVRRSTRGSIVMTNTQEQRLSLRQVGGYLREGKNLLLLACSALTTMVQTGLVCWIARYMLLAYDEPALGATCLTIYWVAATVNRFLAPRIHARPLVLVLWGALFSGLFLGAGIWSGSVVAMCVAVGLTGLTSGHFVPMLVLECADGHRGNTTLTTSMMIFVSAIARVVVPLLMAAVSDAVSVAAGMSVPAVAALASVLFCVLTLRTGGGKRQAG